jgi:ATP-binding cassette subfamily B protein
VVLDAGRVADTGTHEELEERCPLYRRLIVSGEYDDESVRTVEDALDDRAMAAAVASGAGSAGPVPQTRRRAAATVAAAAGPVTAAFASLPPSPEPLAQVDALPPTTDTPDGRWPRPGPGPHHAAQRCGRWPPR